MAVGSVGKPNMSFDDWLKDTNKTGEVKQNAQVKPGAVTDNGVPVGDAQRLQNGESIFDVASNPTPTKETATAGGASSSGVGTQPSGVTDNGNNVNNVPDGNDTTVQGANATGHTPQTQAPELASGLTATQGGDNADAQGGATSGGQINQNLYSQYEAALQEARVADSGEEVSTGEGTLSTGAADGTDATDGVSGAEETSGADGATGVDGGVTASPTDAANPNDPANSPPDDSGNSENPNDSSNDNSASINKQEENRQENILDPSRFRKLDDEAA